MQFACKQQQAFVTTSIEMATEMRGLRQLREALRQQISALTLRKMELQLQRKSLVVVNHQLARAQEEKDKVVLEIDAILSKHNFHVRTHASR